MYKVRFTPTVHQEPAVNSQVRIIIEMRYCISKNILWQTLFSISIHFISGFAFIICYSNKLFEMWSYESSLVILHWMSFSTLNVNNTLFILITLELIAYCFWTRVFPYFHFGCSMSHYPLLIMKRWLNLNPHKKCTNYHYDV